MKKAAKVKIAVFVLGIGLAVFWVGQNRENIPEILQSLFEWVRQRGPMAPVYFVAVYTLATFLWMPMVLLSMAGGLLFGIFPGAFIVTFAALLSSALGYFISHYFLREWVHRQIEKHALLRVIDQFVRSGGWKIVLLTRIVPIFPFITLNFAYGVSKIKPGVFLLASFVGFLPGAFLYAYVGSLAGSLIGAQEYMPVRGEKFFLGLCIAVAVISTVYMTKLIRRGLAAEAQKPITELIEKGKL